MKNRETSLEEEIYLEGTDLLPSVTFLREGSMRIEGKLIPDDVGTFFAPLNEWVSNLRCNKVIFDVDVEYMNSKASVHLFNMLKILNNNPVIQYICVFWHYETEDYEHLEKGKLMDAKLERIKFFYKNKNYVR